MRLPYNSHPMVIDRRYRFVGRFGEWSRREPSDMDEARKGERAGASESIEPKWRTKSAFLNKPRVGLEAGAGIEPANRGFADPDLTTWLPRP